MIDTKELRLGNFILYNGNIIEVTGIIGKLIHHSKGFDSSVGDYDPFKPIPISEEILLKCGFTIGGEGSVTNRTILGISLPNNTAVNGILFHNGKIIITGSEFEYDEPNIKSLHQLQNFWFANTNQELQINL